MDELVLVSTASPLITAGLVVRRMGVVETALLAMQPLLDEADLGSESLAEFIVAACGLCDDTMDKALGVNNLDEIPLVIVFSLDNCSVNKAVVVILAKPMIGAHCHRLNLAASHWTKKAHGGRVQLVLDQIHAVVKRAGTIKNRAALQKHTRCCPVLKNKTRWTGNQTMAVQHSKMHDGMEEPGVFDEVAHDDTEEIDDGISNAPKQVKPALLMPMSKRSFDAHCLPALIEMCRWICCTQFRDLTMDRSNMLFNSMLQSAKLKNQSDEFEARLRPDHSLVTSPHF